jgi:acetyltransferase-like isoleucine patch superfamily enzyme
VKPSKARTAAVAIEDNVFIGMNCLVLKGVTIGQGSVVGAGSVVTKDIPKGVIVARNPAKIIQEIDSKQGSMSISSGSHRC